MFKNIYEEIAYKFKHLPGLKPKSAKNNPYFNASVNDEFVHKMNPDRYNFYMNFMRALADPEVVKNVIYENNLIKVDQEEQSKLVENIIGKLGDLYQLDDYEQKQIESSDNSTNSLRQKNQEKTQKFVDRIADILTDTSENNKDKIKKEVKDTFDIFATGVNYEKMERDKKKQQEDATKKQQEDATKKPEEEADKKQDDAKKKQDDATKKQEDATKKQEDATKKQEEAKKNANGLPRDAFANANGLPRDAFANANGVPRDAFANANAVPRDAFADTNGVPRDAFADTNGVPSDTTDSDFPYANGDSRGIDGAFTDDAINFDNYLKDDKDAFKDGGTYGHETGQLGGDGDQSNQQIGYEQSYDYNAQDSSSSQKLPTDISSVSNLAEQSGENVQIPEPLPLTQEQINKQNAADIKEQTKTKIKESIKGKKEDFKENTDLWNKKKELDRIREDTNKSDSDKAEELKKEIDDIEGDGIMSIKRLEVSREDRLVFIGLTFLLRIVVLTLIEWSLNTNFILTFTNAFLLYICVYSILFVIIIIIVNITYNYPIMDLYTGNHGIFTSMASSFYYFYLIPGSESKHLVRLGVHLGFIIFLTMIAILIKGNEEKNNEGLNYDYAVKRNIKRVINDFTMLLWIFTSIIAMYMI